MGISTHSEADKAYIIFSVYQKDKHDFLNHAQHVASKMLFDNHVEIKGSYRGELEEGLLVPYSELETVKELCKGFKQDCFMVIRNHKHGLYKAWFVYNDVEEFQGYLRQMSKPMIDLLEIDYACNTVTGDYFTLWPTDTTQMDAFNTEFNQRLLEV